ncbi:probable thiopurine S-methyltransferase [Ruditapes philippinarum]|uniref:probable thiopurine S-methyltransferase n=1 Tax=Ruditapes philippinarum TaxID=129788 RepID=UPI00295B4225|nr:probable thiopurine S-methyltransferase [Ruditapes philippinarum]XP_060555169.1 probable thiopurine S-methyltransferase [Ruditapes philippinarum]
MSTDAVGGTLDNDGWKNMWDKGETDFHQSTFDRFLDLRKAELLGENRSVFLPLCGKTLDIIWFYNHGFKVSGVEIAELAVQQFFSENNIECKVESLQTVPGKLYKSIDNKIQLYVADMFEMTPELCGQFDIIWDSKAFVAINRSDRQKYINTLVSLMKKEGRYYLASIDYDPAVWPGPPHSCPDKVIVSNYSGRFNIEILKDADEVMKQKPETREETPVQKHEYDTIQSAFQASSYLLFRWYKMTLK